MLGIPDATDVVDQLWTAASQRAALPLQPDEFFDKTGPLSAHFDCRRQYCRFYLRSKALLKRHDQEYAGYVQDISRTGLGFVSPVQLFPRDQVEIWLSEDRQYTVEVRRCRRVAPECYVCGSCFVV